MVAQGLMSFCIKDFFESDVKDQLKTTVARYRNFCLKGGDQKCPGKMELDQKEKALELVEGVAELGPAVFEQDPVDIVCVRVAEKESPTG